MQILPLSKLLLAYLGTTLVFFAIDLIWLGVIAKGLYQRELGNFLSPQVNWTAAIVFYLLFIIGIFIFCIIPAAEQTSIWKALILGMLFGGFTYATYDLTNLATLKDWPSKIVFIDIAWGMILTGSVSTAGYAIVQWLRQ